jgi:ectoine hydroxylase-related dioxygenase (phytanoyl-CoA dioxygenase family)
MKTKFKEHGFCILENIVSQNDVRIIYHNVLNNIGACAAELNCTPENYLRNVSRWVQPSPITEFIYTNICSLGKRILSDFFGEEVELSKMNVITKSAYASHPIPCHQDIAYSRENPYEFSLWIALQDVDLNSGPLEFLPRSHLGKISPAVDFWDPDFIDKTYLSAHWLNNFVSCPVKTGSAIMFDSRIWHRSSENKLGLNRFAVVTRWSRKSYMPPSDIPEKIMAPFGLWTCGKHTADLLKKGLLHCFQIESTGDIITDIDLWIAQKPGPKAQQVLENLSILHRASLLHNGGDAQGIVYPELWRHFLEPLSRTLTHERTI